MHDFDHSSDIDDYFDMAKDPLEDMPVESVDDDLLFADREIDGGISSLVAPTAVASGNESNVPDAAQSEDAVQDDRNVNTQAKPTLYDNLASTAGSWLFEDIDYSVNMKKRETPEQPARPRTSKRSWPIPTPVQAAVRSTGQNPIARGRTKRRSSLRSMCAWLTCCPAVPLSWRRLLTSQPIPSRWRR